MYIEVTPIDNNNTVVATVCVCGLDLLKNITLEHNIHLIT